MDTLGAELNECLTRHDYATAAQFQNCIMAILDAINGSVPIADEVRSRLFNSLGSSLESMADRVRRNLPAVAKGTMISVDRCAIWRKVDGGCMFSQREFLLTECDV